MIPITRRMALLVTTAAVVPLLVFGLVAARTVTNSTRESVIAAHAALAAGSAESIALYLESSVRLLRAAAADLQGIGLTRDQQQRILSNHVQLPFALPADMVMPEFRELTVFDAAGTPVVSSQLGTPAPRRSALPMPPAPALTILPVEVDADSLPRTTMTLRLQEERATFLVADLRLESLWQLVGNIRVGGTGQALLVDETGRLIADGRERGGTRVARGERLGAHPLADGTGATAAQYVRADGVEVLAVSSAPIRPLQWRLIVEQPAPDAFAAARRLELQLLVFVSLALLANIAIGVAAGRSLLRPISDLLTGIRAIGEGRLDQRVHITRDDEFKLLGEAFNATADKLGELQQAAIRQERQAMFGRIAAGLVHDLSHPIQNINNNCKLVLQMHDDPEYRASFARLVRREFGTIQRTFEDLRNLARPIPLERFPVDAGKLVLDVVERMQVQGSVAGVAVQAGTVPGETLSIEGDLFALGRVLRNLVLNALQATAPGGRVWIDIDGDISTVRVHVCDTGCGIPDDRIQAIFEDFVTTKRRGLGLGLAISRKIVEQLGGAITVASQVGEGSRFTLAFARLTRATRP
ncbi:MAG: sensor histidine kinase [Luteitalea sp.]